MKKRTKKKDKPNTNKLASADSLIINKKKQRIMTPKAGVTVERRPFKFGGYAR